MLPVGRFLEIPPEWHPRPSALEIGFSSYLAPRSHPTDLLWSELVSAFCAVSLNVCQRDLHSRTTGDDLSEIYAWAIDFQLYTMWILCGILVALSREI